MLAYIVRRLLLIIPTLFGIMVINFVIIQAAPGGPVEQIIARVQGTAVEATARIGGRAGSEAGGGSAESAQSSATERYHGAQGLDPQFIKSLEKQFGFDKPLHERFLIMMGNYLTFDFGESYFKDRRVVDLVIDRMPVSISIGLWTTLAVYLVCVPLGIAKAVRDGSRFDVWSSGIVIIGNAIPPFLFAILLIIVFAGGRYLQWFPLRGLLSDEYSGTGFVGCIESAKCIADYFWHITLPLIALLIGSFASLTMLTKNSFLDQIRQQYVITARSKGLTERRVLYGHVFRNGMLIVIAGFPSAFVSILFSSALLIEVIFSLNGLGLLGYEAAINRDYPVMFATIYFFSLLGLLLRLVGDLTYMFVDPRIHFERQDA